MSVGVHATESVPCLTCVFHVVLYYLISILFYFQVFYTPIFLKIGSFYNSPRVKQLSFTVFETIQPISGSGGSTFSLAYVAD